MTPDIRTDPLRFFDHHLASASATFWVEPDTLCVAEPTAAKAVLANRDGLFVEHSDFFHTSRGPFGPRLLQMLLARGARQLLSGHADTARDELPAFLERSLRRSSEWPDAGNRLLYAYFRPVLVAPERADAMAPWLEQVLEHAVRAGARERRWRLTRWLFRRRLVRALTDEIEHRLANPVDTPRDLFDVLAGAGAPGVRPSDLGELYLPFFFAVTGSVGFTLAWSLHLLGDALRGGPSEETDAPSEWIVREALRLWPIAWQMGRRPATAHTILGEEVTPETTVLVSPYVTHRHPAYWSEPTAFRPQRWARPGECTAFLPFGWGPHTCAAASLSLEVARDMLDQLRRSGIVVEPRSTQPFTGPSLAPPRFRLDLTPTPRHATREGGDPAWRSSSRL